MTKKKMLDWLYNFQSLRQEKECDCGVCVFGKLAGVTREDILRDLPGADEGKVTVSEWENWLVSKGFEVTRSQPNDTPVLPRAVLVKRAEGVFHWVYQDETGVHDPDPAFAAMPPHHPDMLNFSAYIAVVLSIHACRKADVSA